MTIQTFVYNGTAWNLITSINSGSINTWDPTQIDWSGITTTDGTGIGGCSGGYGTVGGAGGCGGGGTVLVNSGITTGSTDWSPFAIKPFSKPKGVRPDVLMGFFSTYVHGLLFITDELTYVMPFMERIGLIWVQHEINKWSAYDKSEFYAFIDDPETSVFVGKNLDRKEIRKRMSEAQDE